MCRYRIYTYSCGHEEMEPQPYLPCHPTDFCSPNDTTDKPIRISRPNPCGSNKCATSRANPNMASPTSPGGTSWEQTNSKSGTSGLGEEASAGAKLKEVVDRKMKTSSFARVARSLTKKGRHENKTTHNGGAEFLGNGGTKGYHEIGGEVNEIKS